MQRNQEINRKSMKNAFWKEYLIPTMLNKPKKHGNDPEKH